VIHIPGWCLDMVDDGGQRESVSKRGGGLLTKQGKGGGI
jgi:hypothetical protein